MPSSSPPPKHTDPYFFIIESLNMEDENEERYEGRFLYNYRKILGKNQNIIIFVQGVSLYMYQIYSEILDIDIYFYPAMGKTM